MGLLAIEIMMIVEVENIARLSPVCVLSSLPRPGSRDVDCVGTRERPPPDGKQQCVTPLLSGAPVTTGGYNDFVKSTQRRAAT